MPGYRGHLIGATVLYGVLMYAICANECIPSPSCALEWLGCILAGALFPDIDVKSKGQKYFYIMLLMLLIFLIFNHQFQLAACVGMLSVIPLLVRHRGIFHHPLFVVLLPLVLWFGASIGSCPDVRRLLFFDTVFFICGALSHLALDFVVAPTYRKMHPFRRARR